MARIRACLRKKASSGVQKDNKQEASVLSAVSGEVTLDVDRHEVKVGNELIELTPREFALLQYLLENKGKVLRRDALLEQVWGYDYAGETNAVDVYVRFLRSKLDERFNIKLIHTVRGIGYQIRED